MDNHAFALILAGGGGTRLWPKSREKSPKQLLKLGGEKTLLRMTVDRVQALVDWDHIFIITNASQYADVRREVPELSDTQIIQEPMKRETAMAMALVMNFASDHVVTDQKEFEHVMQVAVEVATDVSKLVAVGISPTFPHTGLGYIQIGSQNATLHNLPVYSVTSFREKPNLELAQSFIASGKYFWNANNYTWSCEALFQALETYAPQIFQAIHAVLPAIGTDSFGDAMKKAYESVESISIDYAVSEKANNLYLVPGDFGWNDIGDWSVVYDLSKKDAFDNAILREKDSGEIEVLDAHRNLVYADGKCVAIVGVEDMVIVDTDEILLVIPKHRSQDVKKIVTQLKEQKKLHLL